MTRRALLLAAALAALPAAAAIARAAGETRETRVVPALAQPGVEPAVARCTSDGPCVVTDADGRTRPGPRLTEGR